MKKEIKICQCCGQKIMINRHCFSGGLAQILLKTAEKFPAGKPFHLQKDISLTHNEYANFQKLAYFGLAQKYVTTTGMHVTGFWYLTIRALKLVRGDAFVEEWVETFNNKVVNASHEMIGIADAIGAYKIPKEYAREQTPEFPSNEHQECLDFGLGGA